MSRKVTPQESLDKVSFIRHLPEEGGSWGRGIILTMQEQAKEIRQLEKAKQALDQQIRDRLRLMRGMARRSEKEAELVGNTKEQINEAQVEAELALAAKAPESNPEEAKTDEKE